MSDDSHLQPAVAAEYLALADILASASDIEWDTPSLCEGWRVREVIAHLTMPARYDEEAFMAELRARLRLRPVVERDCRTRCRVAGREARG